MTIGRFDYDIFGGPHETPIPTSPIVQFTLKRWTNSETGCPILSCHLMTENEIDEYAQALKADIDRVASIAKSDFRKRHPRS